MLVEQILKGIPDNNRLSSYFNIPAPMKTLIDTYNLMAFDKSLPPVTNDTAGHELKSFIRSLTPEEQVSLLNLYLEETGHASQPPVPEEAPACEVCDVDEVETHAFKLFVARIGLIFVAAILIIILSYYLFRADDPNKSPSVVDSFFTTTREVIKFILGLK